VSSSLNCSRMNEGRLMTPKETTASAVAAANGDSSSQLKQMLSAVILIFLRINSAWLILAGALIGFARMSWFAG